MGAHEFNQAYTYHRERQLFGSLLINTRCILCFARCNNRDVLYCSMYVPLIDDRLLIVSEIFILGHSHSETKLHLV